MIDIAAKTRGNLVRLLPQFGVNHFNVNVEKKDNETVSILFFNCSQETLNKIKKVEFIVNHMVRIGASESEIKYEYKPSEEGKVNVNKISR
jgi:hypothetical protein